MNSGENINAEFDELVDESFPEHQLHLPSAIEELILDRAGKLSIIESELNDPSFFREKTTGDVAKKFLDLGYEQGYKEGLLDLLEKLDRKDKNKE